MRQDLQVYSQEDEPEANVDPGYRAAAGGSKSAVPGRQPELERSYSAASSIRRGQSRLQRQDTALSVRWGSINDVDYEELTADLPERSLFLLGKQNILRRAAVYAITNKYFDYAMLATIVANCVTLGMYSQQPGFDESPLGQFLQAADYYFLGVFSLEMLLKVLAMGLVLAPGTYLRSGWNILDGTVVAMGYVDVLMSGSSVTALRAVRVLRPLRTITHIKGLRVPVLTLLHALPMLSDVAILCLFAMFVFGFVAVQMFAGVMQNRCAAADLGSAVLDPSSGTYQNVAYHLPLSAPDQQCSGYLAADITWSQATGVGNGSSSSNSTGTYIWSGGSRGGGWTCPSTPEPAAAPYGMFCARFDNPNNGMTSFDNVVWAWLTIFQCITQEGWTDVMFWLQDALSPWVLVYFVVLIVTGAFFLINLALAVLYLQFTKEFSVSPAASAAVTRSTSLAAGQASVRLVDLQAEPSEQHHAQMTADDYDDDFFGLPPYCGAASMKQAANRVDDNVGEVKGVGSSSVRGSASVGRQTSFQDEEAEVAAGDAFVTAEVVLTSRPHVQDTGQQQQQQQQNPQQNTALAKAVKQGVHYSDGHQSPRVRLQQQHQQQQQQRLHQQQQNQQQQQPALLSKCGQCCSRVRGGIRQACRTMIESGWFSLLSLFMILANTAVMAAASYPMDPAWASASETLNISFTFYFVGELLVKLVGLGPRCYIRDRMNQFDALVVAASLVEVALLLAPGDDGSTSSMSVLRTTRLMRVFKLARSWKELNRIITAVLRSFSQVCYLSLLLLLFVYIIALMGMQLFSHKFASCDVDGAQQLCPPGMQRHECPSYPDCYVPCSESQEATWFSVPGSPYNGLAWCERFPRSDSLLGSSLDNSTSSFPGAPAVTPLAAVPTDTFSYWAQVGKASVPDSRFDNIGWALLTSFQLVTTENWNNVMYSGMAATSPAAALWFIAAIIISNYVLLNLFLAVLLENFGSGSGSPVTSSNGSTSRSNSSGSTLAAAAKAALLLSWLKDLLETSWIAKLVHGPNHDNRVHALGRGPGTRSGEDWGDCTADDGQCFQDAPLPPASKHAGASAATAHAAATIDASTHHGVVVVARGESPAAAAALKRADLESEPSAWTAGGSFTLGTAVSPRGMPETRRFAALVLPPKEPSQLSVASTGPGSFTAKFAVARSGGSVPRFSRMGGMPVSSGFGVEASGGSYSAALLQSNLMLLVERNAAAADGFTAQCAVPTPGLPVVSFSSGSMLPPEQQHGPLNARAALFGMAAAAAGMKSMGSRIVNLAASGYWEEQDVDPSSGTRSRSSNIKLSGTSCCVLGPDNWLRQKLAQLTTHKQFENFILLLIFFSSSILALEMPSLDHDGLFFNTLEYIDMAFVVLFALEALVKILVRGFVANGPGSYLHNPWNMLDFFIVVLGVVMMTITLAGGDVHSLSSLRALRTLRALRPLRVASRLEGMKVVVDALFASLPPLGNIVLVCLLFYLVFGIMGVHLLAGRLYSCQDLNGNFLHSEYVLPQGQYITREWCEDAAAQVTTPAYHSVVNVTLPAYTPQRRWVNRVANFDNILMAILTLFQISTTELWVNTMYDSVAAVGIDQQPRDGHNPALAVFFVVFMIFGCFFVLQLFIATALEQFAKMHQEKGRSVLLTVQQEEWLTIQRMIADTILQPQPVPPSRSRWRIAVFKAVMSSYSELLVMAAIIANVLIMAATHADMSQAWQDFMSYANVGFTVFFTLEAAAKLLALGWKQYLRDAWCRFDLFVVLVSIAGVCVDLATPQNLEVLPLLRVLRLVRVFRLIPKAEGLRNLLRTLVFSLPALGNIGGVLLLFFFMYAVVGMNLFGAVKHGQYLDRHSNFSNVGMALVVLFRMITGESWDSIMQDCMVTSECMQVLQDVNVTASAGQAAISVAAGTWLDADDALVKQLPADMLGNHCSPAPLAAVVYFCSFVLLCGLVLVNFVIGVIIDNMQSSNNSEDMPISSYHVERFTRAWSERDPTASQYIPAVELSSLLRELPPPMGVRGEEGEQAKIQSIIMSVDIPIRKKNKVHFVETLHALAGRVAGTLLPEGEESKVHRRLYPRLPLPPADPQDAPKYTVAHFYAALYVQAAVRGFLRRHALCGAGGATMGFQSMASAGFQSINLGALGEPSPDEER